MGRDGGWVDRAAALWEVVAGRARRVEQASRRQCDARGSTRDGPGLVAVQTRWEVYMLEGLAGVVTAERDTCARGT